ncbi:MAG: magnesium/cobalt transporter CorA [Saprospiraceae bacterium]|nr:magnesium/cobalt transporter CorA [Saprospiraceae bacterium]
MPPGSLVYTGHRKDVPTTVYTLRYNVTDFHQEEAYLPEWKQGQGVLWIDIHSLTDVGFIQQVGNDFELHPLLLEDVLDTQQRPKMEEYDNGLFIIVPSLHLDVSTLDLQVEQIAFFLSEHFVLSFQEDPDDDFMGVRKRAQEDLGRIRKKGTDYLTYALIDTIVDSYYTVLDELETVLFELEAILHQQGDVPWCKGRIFDLRRAVNEFRHQMVPMRDAIARLHQTESSLVHDTTRVYIRDVVDHIAQIIDGIDYQQSMIANTESLYHAEASNRLNNVMRLLAIISTIFMPLSFIAGVYGMNFDNMPELHTEYGYFWVLGVMGMAMVGMLISFRQQRWI